jgi:hypothetical protein
MDVRERVRLNIQRLRREKGLRRTNWPISRISTRPISAALNEGKRNPTITVLQLVVGRRGCDSRCLRWLAARFA